MKTLKNFSHFIQPVEKKKSEPCQIIFLFCFFLLVLVLFILFFNSGEA